MRTLEIAGIQWHPGFYGAAELEFLSDKDNLEFQREYNLSKEPIRMDLLVIKKLSDTHIRNELGHLFKRYNVIEYKSPDDSLTIDDYYKVTGYACLYEGLGETVDQLPEEEVTVSFFREGYPRELFEKLKGKGCDIKEYRPGIYYITGEKALFATQVIVIRQLDSNMHHFLRILSRSVQEVDAERFIKETSQLTEPGERNNVSAALQASISANREIYERIRKEDNSMCDALMELMKEDIDRIKEEYGKKVIEEYEKKGQEALQKTLQEAIKNLMDSTKWTAEQAMDAMKLSEEERKRLLKIF